MIEGCTVEGPLSLSGAMAMSAGKFDEFVKVCRKIEQDFGPLLKVDVDSNLKTMYTNKDKKMFKKVLHRIIL